MNKLNNALTRLIEISMALGLNDTDLNNAREYLIHNEYGLCFDTLITQLYEYDIEISIEFYELIGRIGELLNLEESFYSFMKELIRDGSTIPKTVKDELAIIITNLKK
ncbi:MafI family immunity protein [Chryseobacterium sp. WG14]|uniref:MafI family immunity protein n=1 Tax=Chryseobacterium sp. WG14 TaxID=2926909 RepID=UPI00211ED2D7|nr:MafI family immunity protein [Chryseobacterium sp. WG14]MCQ9639769.1 MafI family immunity protein [Chryseobacterium sp. WG14]